VAAFRKLDSHEKELMLRFLRLVAKDSISSVLAILDGVVFLPGQEDQLVLKYGDTLLSGDLQDIFLEQMESED